LNKKENTRQAKKSLKGEDLEPHQHIPQRTLENVSHSLVNQKMLLLNKPSGVAHKRGDSSILAGLKTL
jgi:hypothetical protein